MENGNRFPKAETPRYPKENRATETPSKRQSKTPSKWRSKRQATAHASPGSTPHSQRDIWAHGNRRGESFFGGRRNLKFQSSRQGAEKSAYRVVFQRSKGSGFERGGNAGRANGAPMHRKRRRLYAVVWMVLHGVLFAQVCFPVSAFLATVLHARRVL